METDIRKAVLENLVGELMPTSTTMSVVRVHRFGGPHELVLERVDIPEPRPGEALVRVIAAGVGPWDALIRSGRSGLEQTLPLTPGSDIAGIVQRIHGGGANAAVAIGEAVYGVTNDSFTGGYAQYAVASLGCLAHKPRRLSFVEAKDQDRIRSRMLPPSPTCSSMVSVGFGDPPLRGASHADTAKRSAA